MHSPRFNSYHWLNTLDSSVLVVMSIVNNPSFGEPVESSKGSTMAGFLVIKKKKSLEPQNVIIVEFHDYFK